MRLKKIPKGTQYLIITNNSSRDCILYLDKKSFSFIAKDSIHFWEAKTFIVDMPMETFPEWQFYANSKLDMEFR